MFNSNYIKSLFLNKRIIFISFFSLCYCNVIIPQSIDSQVNQLKSLRSDKAFQTKHESVDKLNSLAYDYTYINPDSSIFLGKEAIRISSSQNYYKGKAEALNNVARSYYVKGTYDSTLVYSEQALNISNTFNDTLNKLISINNIGLVFIEHNEYKSAILQFQNEILLAKAIHNNLHETRALFNLGLCYDESGEYDKAIELLHIALEKDKVNPVKQVTALAYDRLGKTYFHSKNYPQSIAHYLIVRNDKAIKDPWELSFCYVGLAETYFAMGEYAKSLKNAHISFNYASSIHAKWEAEQALSILAKCYALDKNYEKAYYYLQLDKLYKDSLTAQNTQEAADYFKIQQKEAANQSLEKENRFNEQKLKLAAKINLIIGVFAIIIILGFILLWVYYRKTLKLNTLLLKKNADIDQLNTMKDQLFYVISHDLRSPMNSLQQSLELINRKILSPEKQSLLLEALQQQVTLSGKMLNDLLAWAATQQSGITAKIEPVYTEEVIQELLTLLQPLAERKQINLHMDVAPVLQVLSDRDQLKIIIQNLLTNAIKFTPLNGEIKVYFTETDQDLIIHIQDNGVGMSPEKKAQLFHQFGSKVSNPGTEREKGTGIGLMLVNEFAKLNNVKIQIDSEEGKGTTFSVILPKATNS